MAAIDSLVRAALALPILVLPAKASAAEVGEVGITLLGYKERGLMKVTEPVLWVRAQFLDAWEVQASVAVDIITGASAQLVTNASGAPVQSISGASINDRRNTGDLKVTRTTNDRAMVKAPPPLFYIVPLILAIPLEFVKRLKILPPSQRQFLPQVRWTGVGIIVVDADTEVFRGRNSVQPTTFRH